MVTTVTAERLAEMLDDDESFTLVDTRPEDSFESWHVRGARNFPFGPEEELDGRLEEFREFAGDADRVVTICAKGISSANLATQLESATDEFDVTAVEGGMKDWSGVYDHVDLEVDADVAIVQIQRRAKGCLSYLVGCPETGEAIVVDPTDDVDEFTGAAGERGLEIVGVLDTHVHADHVSGGRRLASALGVPYYLGERADERDVAYDFEPLARNEVLEAGALEVKAVAAPGHTSEMINPLVDDVALLTADTLHVDSTGRTELEVSEARRASENANGERCAARGAARKRAGSTATRERTRPVSESEDEGETGARMLHETLHRTILAEPESVAVLPGHVEVSADGEFGHGSPGDPIGTTIREARTGIDALQLEEEAFVDRLADAGEKPANYEEIIAINRGAAERPPEDRVELELGPNNCSA